MNLRLFLVLCLAALVHFAGEASDVLDRLRDLDRLRAEGLISQETYEEQWQKTVDEAMRGYAPGAPQSAVLKRREIGGWLSWSSLDAGEAEADLLAAQATFGYFVTSRFELIGSVGYLKADIGDLDTDALTLGAGFDFHLTSGGTFVPYVGAGVLWGRLDVEDLGHDDDWAWDVRAGFKQHVAENVVVRYQVGYQSFDKLELDGFTVSVGLSFAF